MMSFERFSPAVQSRNPHPVDGQPVCKNEHPTGWICTRAARHDGRHEAGMAEGDGITGPELIAASWAQ